MGGLAIIFVISMGFGIFKMLYEAIFKACHDGRTWEENYERDEEIVALKAYLKFQNFLNEKGFIEKESKTEDTDMYWLFRYFVELFTNEKWIKNGYIQKYGWKGTIEKFENYGDHNPEKFEIYLEQLDTMEKEYGKKFFYKFNNAFKFAYWHSSYYLDKIINQWHGLERKYAEELTEK